MDADVVIVGAGPAGAWTAYGLARRGARVLLFDPSHPREKPCGGGVTGRALSIVAEAVSLDRLPAVHVRSARFLDRATGVSAAVPLDRAKGPADRMESSERCRTGERLIVASRRDFDAHLVSAAERAGATLVPARVSQVARDNGAFRVLTADGRTYSTRWMIGADGANSFVRRRMGKRFPLDQLSIATGFFAHGAVSDEIVIEMMADPPGYLWSFPRVDHLAIGICAQADAGKSAAALRAVTATWIGETSIGAGARLQPYSWPIPSLSVEAFDTLEIAGPGWLLVGDAAGLVDPVTREGIYFALKSAEHAADALTVATGEPDRQYFARVRGDIVPELIRAAQLKARFFRPRFTRLLMQALQQSEGIRRVMADLVAGTQTYRGLEWRLAKTLEVGLAWELLQMRSAAKL